MQQTLSIIKPDAVKKGVVGKIIDRFESHGLRIAAAKKLCLSAEDAGKFYEICKSRAKFRRGCIAFTRIALSSYRLPPNA